VSGYLIFDPRPDRKRIPLQRRRGDCASLGACEEAWCQARAGGQTEGEGSITEQARCLPACPHFVLAPESPRPDPSPRSTLADHVDDAHPVLVTNRRKPRKSRGK